MIKIKYNEIENMYIDEILEYQDILKQQIDKENEIVCRFGGLSEKEQVYDDINCYAYNDFIIEDVDRDRKWTEKELKDYILYLEELTGLTNKLGIVKEDEENE